jgi:lactoylglutathione lyase
MTIKAIGHIGVCVTDMERSLGFYQHGLGFEVIREWDFAGKNWGRLLEVDDLNLHSKLLQRETMSIELLHFLSPPPTGSSERRPWNQIGFAHLAVWVDDIDVEGENLQRHGGHIIESTRTTFDHPNLHGRWLICTDPDGTRIELVEYPDGEDVLPARGREMRRPLAPNDDPPPDPT